MIALILISLAGICKAIADTIEFHFDTSIFRHSKFWVNGGKIIFGKYKFDGWHIINSGMIIFFTLSAVIPDAWIYFPYAWYYKLATAGVLYNLTFNIFYNKILRR